MYLVPIIRKHYLRFWPYLVFGSLALLVTTWITISIPQYSKTIVNAITAGADGGEYKTLALWIIGLGLLQILVRSLSRVLIFWPARKAETSIKSYYFSRFLRLPQTFFDQFGKGDLVSRLANDVGQLRGFLGFGVLQAINFSILAIVALRQMLQTHAGLTIACLLPLSVMALITRFAMPKLHQISRKQQETLAELTNKVTEGYYHVHTLQTTGTTQTMGKLIQDQNKKLYQANMKLVIFRMLLFPMLSLLGGISYLVVLVYGGLLILSDNLTVGDLLAFNIYIGLLIFPLTALGFLVASLQRAKAASERLYDLEKTQVESSQKSAAVSDDSGSDFGDPVLDIPLLEAKNLSFTYPNASNASLDNISFKLMRGQKLGIAGPIGAGKSTLMNLITRLYNAPENSLFFAGKDILTVEPKDLRKKLAYATQNPQLFSDSIADNLKLGAPYSSEDLISVCKKTDILQDIENFPDGFTTLIGEQGVRLSGGQKQRLALSRVLLREPELLLLDDVLSAVDHRTEKKIIQVLEGLQATTLIISHRASVLQSCDFILVLADGECVDVGPSREMLKKHHKLFLGNQQLDE